MIDIIPYSPEKSTEWDNFIDESRTPMFMFKRPYMDYHQDRFMDYSLMIYEKNELVGVIPANLKGKEFISHGGLTFGGLITNQRIKQVTYNEVFDRILIYLRDHGIEKVVYKKIPHIYSTIPNEEDEYSLFTFGAQLCKVEPSTVVDLKNPLKMPKGRKAQISRAKREGVTVLERSDRDSFEDFFDIENSVLSERHNTKAVHTTDEMFLLKTRFPDNIRLIVAFYEETIIAGTILYCYPNLIHTQYMGANEMARKIGALDLVISNVITAYADDKRWFDFGISSENNGTFLNAGLISQKEGFGGRTNVYKTYEIML